MRNKTLVAMVGCVLMLGLMVGGCGNKKEEQMKAQLNKDLENLSVQVKEMEAHNANLEAMVVDMQLQLDLMQEELDKAAPRIQSAKASVASLKTQLYGLEVIEAPKDPKAKKSHAKLWIFAVIVLVGGFFVYRSFAGKSES